MKRRRKKKIHRNLFTHVTWCALLPGTVKMYTKRNRIILIWAIFEKIWKKNIPNYSKSEAYIFLLSYLTLNVRLSSCNCLWRKCNRKMYKLFSSSSYIFILDAFHAFDVLHTQCTEFPASCDTNLIYLQIRRIELGNKCITADAVKLKTNWISSTSGFSRCPKFKSDRWA